MVPAATYHARRWRSLFEPQALNFTSSAPRQAAVPVYSAAPTGIHCGLPKAARAVRSPRAAVLLLPMVAGELSRGMPQPTPTPFPPANQCAKQPSASSPSWRSVWTKPGAASNRT